jgi:DNA processing protein
MWSIPRTCRPSGAHRRKRPYHQRNAPGTEPTNRHFPARNRIIAGLAMGTVVVEAALQSGSLITARLAGDYGREVMAVPGSPLDPRSHGCNQMIREGAILVQGGRHPRTHHQLSGPAAFAFPRRGGWSAFAQENQSEEAIPEDVPQSVSERIEALLGVAPVGVGEIIRQSGADTAQVQAALIDMELAGMIQRHAGGGSAGRWSEPGGGGFDAGALLSLT